MKIRGDKLTANAFYLVAATAITSFVGLLFWGLAAHEGHARNRFADYGRAYAEVAALTLVSVVAQFNLTNVFIRFLPAAGRLSTYFVRRGYVGVVIAAFVLGAAFVLSGLGSTFLQAGLLARVLFVASVALFAIFALQDSVLTALRITHWVPIENATFAVVKLLLLAVFIAAWSMQTAILLAWVIPVLIAVLLVNVLLFRRALPAAAATDGGGLPERRRLMSFVAAEYLQNLCQLAPSALLPLIVIWKLDATREGYFAVPWLIGAGIATVFWNIATSFIVEAVAAGEQSAQHVRRTIAMWLALVAIAMVACIAIGPPILGLIGESQGAALLRLIGLASPFTFIFIMYQAFVWLDQRVWLILAITACSAVVMIALSLILIPSAGITGVGWAYLVAQAGAATLMAPRLWSRVTTVLRSPTPVPLVGAGDPPGAPRRRKPSWKEVSLVDRSRMIVTARIGLGVAVVAPLLIVAAPWNGLSLIAVLALAAAGFGPAVTCWIDTGDPVAQVALTVVISLAVFALTSALLIWAAWWHPVALLLLVLPTAASCVHRLATQRGLSPSSARA
ncbi:MAG: lipopolysaccharide biosynthesis protein [Solirubrobacteraceae bacterium]